MVSLQKVFHLTPVLNGGWGFWERRVLTYSRRSLMIMLVVGKDRERKPAHFIHKRVNTNLQGHSALLAIVLGDYIVQYMAEKGTPLIYRVVNFKDDEFRGDVVHSAVGGLLPWNEGWDWLWPDLRRIHAAPEDGTNGFYSVGSVNSNG
jgi:hypothetical protein